MSDLVLTERVDNVLVATLNRPEARNALNPALIDELSGVLRSADADPAVRAIVLTGAGTVFCAGMDLKAFAQGGGKFDGLVWFFREGIGTPVIAALNGSALGGGFEMVLACDLVVAAEDAKLGIAEVKRGLFAAGAVRRSPTGAAGGRPGDGSDRRSGHGRAGRAGGLVNRAVPADRVREEALALAGRIAANGPLGVAMTKKLIRERRWAEPDEVTSVFRSRDAAEGARAFAERRTPLWTGS